MERREIHHHHHFSLPSIHPSIHRFSFVIANINMFREMYDKQINCSFATILVLPVEYELALSWVFLCKEGETNTGFYIYGYPLTLFQFDFIPAFILAFTYFVRKYCICIIIGKRFIIRSIVCCGKKRTIDNVITWIIQL